MWGPGTEAEVLGVVSGSSGMQMLFRGRNSGFWGGLCIGTVESLGTSVGQAGIFNGEPILLSLVLLTSIY